MNRILQRNGMGRSKEPCEDAGLRHVWVAIDTNGADMALAKLGAKATDEVMIRNHTIECHRDRRHAHEPIITRHQQCR